MKCEICGRDKDPLNILPIQQPDGRSNTIACNDCARQTKFFCKVHKRPHQAFIDGTNACLACIQELAIAHQNRAKEIYEILEQKLIEAEWKKLKLCIGFHAVFANESFQNCIITIISSLAMRLGSTFENILNVFLDTGEIDLLIPDECLEDQD